MLEDLDIYRAAGLLLEKHGTEAVFYAAEWAGALREAGNPEDARRLEQIILAIDQLERARGLVPDERPAPVRTAGETAADRRPRVRRRPLRFVRAPVPPKRPLPAEA